MTNDDKLLVEMDSAVLTLTLNRPQVKNAIDWDLRRALAAAFAEAASSDSVRVVVLRGAGGNFCSGGDIRQMGRGAEDTLAKLDLAAEIVTAIATLDKPVIAAVEGAAAGAGMSLALACDLVVARADARFHASFVLRGLAPDMGGSYWLTRQLGPSRARQLLLEGRTLDSSEALGLGIVAHVWDPDEFDQQLDAYAKRIASAPTRAMATIKTLVDQAVRNELSQQLVAERSAQVALSTTVDHAEAIAAFSQRRTPVFTGR